MSRAWPARTESSVVGVTFVPGYPSTIYNCERLVVNRMFALPDLDDSEGIPAVLRRNPENEHDANAIEVHVPGLGDPGMIGHLPRNLAAKIAPMMDADPNAWSAAISNVFINENHPDRPGITIIVYYRQPDDYV